MEFDSGYHPVICLPVCDYKRAVKVRKVVDNFYPSGHSFTSLRLARALTLYNLNITDQSQMKDFLGRPSRVVKKELQAAKSSSPLPTIGFEIENLQVPLKRLSDLSSFKGYSLLMPALNFPPNVANGNGFPGEDSFYEIAPHPSFSASTQAEIIHQLIYGGFIASITPPKIAEDIRDLPNIISKCFTQKCVSLHINIGLPVGIHLPFGDHRINQQEKVEDWDILTSVFPFVYTSPVRLHGRNQNSFWVANEAFAMHDIDGSVRCEGGGGKRLEMKAFEVRNKDTYRALINVQLWSAALFAYLGGQYPDLIDQWMDIKDEVKPILSKFGFTTVAALYDKSVAVAFVTKEVGGKTIGQCLRPVVERHSRRIATVVEKYQS